MNEIHNLTEHQQLIKDYLQIQLNLFREGFYDAKDRNIGKTVIINNLGLEYQALGYDVYIATPTFFSNEYLGERYDFKSPDKTRGKRFSDKTIVLVDELDINELLLLEESILHQSNGDKVKLLGFIRY